MAERKSPTEGPLIVFAGTYQQFRNFCHEEHLTERKDAVYVSSSVHLQGRMFGRDRERYVGTFFDRADYQEIMDVRDAIVSHWEATRPPQSPERP